MIKLEISFVLIIWDKKISLCFLINWDGESILLEFINVYSSIVTAIAYIDSLKLTAVSTSASSNILPHYVICGYASYAND